MISGNPGRSDGSSSVIDVTITTRSDSIDEDEIRKLVQFVLDQEKSTCHFLGVILCGRHEHVDLHERYLGLATPTDVLAFDLEPESDALEGEIYVDLDTARERHAEFGATFHEEVYRYVVHGLLHLLGYRDKSEADARKMRNRQEAVLASWINSRNRSD